MQMKSSWLIAILWPNLKISISGIKDRRESRKETRSLANKCWKFVQQAEIIRSCCQEKDKKKKKKKKQWDIWYKQ